MLLPLSLEPVAALESDHKFSKVFGVSLLNALRLFQILCLREEDEGNCRSSYVEKENKSDARGAE